MRRLLTLLTSLLVSIGAAACGDTSPYPSSASQTTSNAIAAERASTANSATATREQRHVFGDYDDDDDSYGQVSRSDGDDDDIDKPTDIDGDSDSSGDSYYDSDDNKIRSFGHAANPIDEQTITALVKRYYAAAAADNVAKGCSLISRPLAKTLPEDLGEAGPHYLHGGKTCVGILSKIFGLNHQQFTAYVAKLEGTGVRVTGDLGLVVLSFKTLPRRLIEVIREHGTWKIYALTDTELP